MYRDIVNLGRQIAHGTGRFQITKMPCLDNVESIWGGRSVDGICPFGFLVPWDLMVKSDCVCWSKAKSEIKCVLSYSDLTPSRMEQLRPGERYLTLYAYVKNP